MYNKPATTQALRSTCGLEWFVLGVDRAGSGSLASIQLVSRADAELGRLDRAFRLPAAEFRVFCAFTGIESAAVEVATAATVARAGVGAGAAAASRARAPASHGGSRYPWSEMLEGLHARARRSLRPITIPFRHSRPDAFQPSTL